MPAWSALERGCKRVAIIWPRRAGKDEVALHWTACAAIQRPANYWHLLPKANQARKALWDAVNPHTGKRRIDEAFPQEIREVTRDHEMLIRFVNGATWQVVGADNFNQLVGSPPVGIVLSEYPISDPHAWDYLSPILRENGGWAIFPYTPRGKNHGFELYTNNKSNPEWFVQRLTVDDTKHITKADIEAERREGKSEEFIQQEYYCSFEAPNSGAYYGRLMSQAWESGRICSIPIEPGIDCETYWDLGMDDSMAIWILQPAGREIRFVQYYEAQGEGLSHYINWLKDWAEKHNVRFSRHGMPHDIEVREIGTGKSRKETAYEMGLRPITVARKLEIEDGINAVRRLLPRCLFDKERCKMGIRALTDYAKDYDDKHKVFRTKPRHDWASHGADGFRTFGVIYRDQPQWAGGSNVTVQKFGSGPIIHKQDWSPHGAPR